MSTPATIDLDDLLAARGLSSGAITTLTGLLPQASEIVDTKAQLVAWAAGTITGGPDHNGNYPFTLPDHTVAKVPCPAKIAAMNGDAAGLIAAQAAFNAVLAQAQAARVAAETARDQAIAAVAAIGGGQPAAPALNFSLATNGQFIPLIQEDF